jgi:hypothetical protein
MGRSGGKFRAWNYTRSILGVRPHRGMSDGVNLNGSGTGQDGLDGLGFPSLLASDDKSRRAIWAHGCGGDSRTGDDFAN